MSEYQYYEFQTVDRPLTALEQQELRALSTRARITATSFVNSYEWGDFKGNPSRLMERYFDLHLYLANWGSRHFSLRLPGKLVDRNLLDAFLGEVDIAEVRSCGDNLLIEIVRDELDVDDFEDGSGRLAALSTLRADILSGDLRMFYLLWLTAVEADVFELEEPEPMAGIGPLNAGLKAFAEFFQIDDDLVAAAAERNAYPVADELTRDDVEAAIASLPEVDRTGFLMRLHDGDAHVGAELRKRVRTSLRSKVTQTPVIARSVGALRACAAAMAHERQAMAKSAATKELARKAKEEADARAKRLDSLSRRGESVWREVEREIEFRNATSYDRAARLLVDLRDIATTAGSSNDFNRRLAGTIHRHSKKKSFLERLRALRFDVDE